MPIPLQSMPRPSVNVAVASQNSQRPDAGLLKGIDRDGCPAEGGRCPAVTIEFSEPANYRRVAQSLGDAIGREFGASVKLVASRGPAFEISIDGRLIFSKRATARFPDHDEIFYHVRAAC